MKTNQNTQIGINPTTGMDQLEVILPVGDKEDLLRDHQAAIELLTKYSDQLSDWQRYLVERLIAATTPNPDTLIFTNHNTTTHTTKESKKWPLIEIQINDQEDYDMILAATIAMLDDVFHEAQQPNARAIDQWKSIILMWILRDMSPDKMQKAS